MALQQTSELLAVEGARLVGPIPAEVQAFTRTAPRGRCRSTRPRPDRPSPPRGPRAAPRESPRPRGAARGPRGGDGRSGLGRVERHLPRGAVRASRHRGSRARTRRWVPPPRSRPGPAVPAARRTGARRGSAQRDRRGGGAGDPRRRPDRPRGADAERFRRADPRRASGTGGAPDRRPSRISASKPFGVSTTRSVRAPSVLATPARAAEIMLLTTGAYKPVAAALVPGFERRPW
jgi:hypothetical protein